jgi:hypothetical protein
MFSTLIFFRNYVSVYSSVHIISIYLECYRIIAGFIHILIACREPNKILDFRFKIFAIYTLNPCYFHL